MRSFWYYLLTVGAYFIIAVAAAAAAESNGKKDIVIALHTNGSLVAHSAASSLLPSSTSSSSPPQWLWALGSEGPLRHSTILQHAPPPPPPHSAAASGPSGTGEMLAVDRLEAPMHLNDSMLYFHDGTPFMPVSSLVRAVLSGRGGGGGSSSDANVGDGNSNINDNNSQRHLASPPSSSSSSGGGGGDGDNRQWRDVAVDGTELNVNLGVRVVAIDPFTGTAPSSTQSTPRTASPPSPPSPCLFSVRFNVDIHVIRDGVYEWKMHVGDVLLLLRRGSGDDSDDAANAASSISSALLVACHRKTLNISKCYGLIADYYAMQRGSGGVGSGRASGEDNNMPYYYGILPPDALSNVADAYLLDIAAPLPLSSASFSSSSSMDFAVLDVARLGPAPSQQRDDDDAHDAGSASCAPSTHCATSSSETTRGVRDHHHDSSVPVTAMANPLKPTPSSSLLSSSLSVSSLASDDVGGAGGGAADSDAHYATSIAYSTPLSIGVKRARLDSIVRSFGVMFAQPKALAHVTDEEIVHMVRYGHLFIHHDKGGALGAGAGGNRNGGGGGDANGQENSANGIAITDGSSGIHDNNINDNKALRRHPHNAVRSRYYNPSAQQQCQKQHATDGPGNGFCYESLFDTMPFSIESDDVMYYGLERQHRQQPINRGIPHDYGSDRLASKMLSSIGGLGGAFSRLQWSGGGGSGDLPYRYMPDPSSASAEVSAPSPYPWGRDLVAASHYGVTPAVRLRRGDGEDGDALPYGPASMAVVVNMVAGVVLFAAFSVMLAAMRWVQQVRDDAAPLPISARHHSSNYSTPHHSPQVSPQMRPVMGGNGYNYNPSSSSAAAAAASFMHGSPSSAQNALRRPSHLATATNTNHTNTADDFDARELEGFDLNDDTTHHYGGSPSVVHRRAGSGAAFDQHDCANDVGSGVSGGRRVSRTSSRQQQAAAARASPPLPRSGASSVRVGRAGGPSSPTDRRSSGRNSHRSGSVASLSKARSNTNKKKLRAVASSNNADGEGGDADAWSAVDGKRKKKKKRGAKVPRAVSSSERADSKRHPTGDDGADICLGDNIAAMSNRHHYTCTHPSPATPSSPSPTTDVPLVSDATSSSAADTPLHGRGDSPTPLPTTAIHSTTADIPTIVGAGVGGSDGSSGRGVGIPLYQQPRHQQQQEDASPDHPLSMLSNRVSSASLDQSDASLSCLAVGVSRSAFLANVTRENTMSTINATSEGESVIKVAEEGAALPAPQPQTEAMQRPRGDVSRKKKTKKAASMFDDVNEDAAANGSGDDDTGDDCDEDESSRCTSENEDEHESASSDDDDESSSESSAATSERSSVAASNNHSANNHPLTDTANSALQHKRIIVAANQSSSKACGTAARDDAPLPENEDGDEDEDDECTTDEEEEDEEGDEESASSSSGTAGSSTYSSEVASDDYGDTRDLGREESSVTPTHLYSTNLTIEAIRQRNAASQGMVHAFRDDYTVVKRIGNGTDGTVFVVQSRLTKALYAVKAICIAGDADRRKREALLHSKMENSSVIPRFYHTWMEEMAVSTIVELDMYPDTQSLLDYASMADREASECGGGYKFSMGSSSDGGASLAGGNNKGKQHATAALQNSSTSSSVVAAARPTPTGHANAKQPKTAALVPVAAAVAVERDAIQAARDLREAQLRDATIPVLFIKMEYFRAGTLRDFLFHRSQYDYDVTSRQWKETAWRLVLSMAKSLRYLHDCKIIHRDVKPSNIFLGNGTFTSYYSKRDRNGNSNANRGGRKRHHHAAHYGGGSMHHTMSSGQLDADEDEEYYYYDDGGGGGDSPSFPPYEFWEHVQMDSEHFLGGAASPPQPQQQSSLLTSPNTNTTPLSSSLPPSLTSVPPPQRRYPLPTLKLGDFGRSVDTTDPDYRREHYESVAGIPQPKNISFQEVYEGTFCFGSIPYSSPEQMNGQLLGFPTDIYSLGMVAVELFQNFKTDHEKMSVLGKIINNSDPHSKVKDRLPDNMRGREEFTMLANMLSPTPSDRPKITYIVRGIERILDGMAAAAAAAVAPPTPPNGAIGTIGGQPQFAGGMMGAYYYQQHQQYNTAAAASNNANNNPMLLSSIGQRGMLRGSVSESDLTQRVQQFNQLQQQHGGGVLGANRGFGVSGPAVGSSQRHYHHVVPVPSTLNGGPSSRSNNNGGGLTDAGLVNPLVGSCPSPPPQPPSSLMSRSSSSTQHQQHYQYPYTVGGPKPAGVRSSDGGSVGGQSPSPTSSFRGVARSAAAAAPKDGAPSPRRAHSGRKGVGVAEGHTNLDGGDTVSVADGGHMTDAHSPIHARHASTSQSSVVPTPSNAVTPNTGGSQRRFPSFPFAKYSDGTTNAGNSFADLGTPPLPTPPSLVRRRGGSGSAPDSAGNGKPPGNSFTYSHYSQSTTAAVAAAVTGAVIGGVDREGDTDYDGVGPWVHSTTTVSTAATTEVGEGACDDGAAEEVFGAEATNSIVSHPSSSVADPPSAMTASPMTMTAMPSTSNVGDVMVLALTVAGGDGAVDDGV